MKKGIVVLVFVVLNLFQNYNIYGQANVFSKIYSFPGQESQIVQSYDKGYIITGAEILPYIMKVDSSGNYLWAKNFGTYSTTSWDASNNITKTKDSCFVFVYNYYVPSDTLVDLICVKINTNGDTIWSQKIKNGVSNYSYSIEQTFDNGFIILGNTSTNKVMVTKLDAFGNLQWSKKIGSTSILYSGYSLKQVRDSSYVMNIFISDTTNDVALINISPSGNILWSKKYNRFHAGFCGNGGLEVTLTGILNYFYADSILVFMKTDYSGNILWNKFYNSHIEFFNCINCLKSKLHSTSDGGFIINTFSNANDRILKIDSLGNYQWSDTVLFISSEVIEAKDKGFIILGNGLPLGKLLPFQVGIIKTDSIGTPTLCMRPSYNNMLVDSLTASPIAFTISSGGTSQRIYPVITNLLVNVDTGCVNMEILKISEFSNESSITIFPNPTTSTFTVTSTINIKSLKVYDVLGSLITNYKLQITNGGSATIDITGVSKGIYFVEIKTETGVERRKIVKE